MIALFLASVALHPVIVTVEGHRYNCGVPMVSAHGEVSLPGDCYRAERFFCKYSSEAQCAARTREFYCQERRERWPSDDRVAQHYAKMIHARCAKEIESLAYRKCGPEGTVDWDPNPQSPPPHCNRNGWNGRRYQPEGR